MPKILMLIQGLKIGGLENVVYNLSRSIKDSGKFELEICCFDSRGVYWEQLEKKGITIHFLPRKAGTDLVYPFKLASLIRRRKIDIIQAHNYTAWFYGTLAAFLAKKKIVYTEHDNSHGSSRYVMAVCSILKKMTAKIVTVSEKVRETLSKCGNIQNAMVIYNGVDQDSFIPVKASEKERRKIQYGFQEEDIILGMVGRIDALKNQECILNALPELKKCGLKTKLLFVGDGILKKSLKAKAKKMKLDECVVFLGERHDIPELLSMLDVFLLPSLSEGLPVSVIEAMASGLPIIASRVGGIPELITSESSGILINPNNLDELVNALKLLIGNKEKRVAMGSINRKIAEDKFSLKVMARQYLEVYSSCLNN